MILKGVVCSAVGGAVISFSVPACSITVPRACMTTHLGTHSQAGLCMEFPGQMGPDFALSVGGALGCALCSVASVSRSVGWAVPLRTCSAEVPWLGRPKAVLSNGRVRN